MASHLFKWSGQPVGFISNGSLFDSAGSYVGWVESDGRAWAKNGSYLGDLVDGNYILKSPMRIDPIPRIPRVPPISPIPPIPPLPRMPRMPKLGWFDALDRG